MEVTLTCPQCKDRTTVHRELDGRLESCPVCSSLHLFRRKDFDRKLGLALVGIGIVGAYFTYGLSLLAVTIIDWWLYRRVGEVAVCYQCETEFRDVFSVALVPEFSLSLHDYYENLRRRAHLGDHAEGIPN